MLNGQRVDASLQNGVPFVDHAEIQITNIFGANGAIHVIDAALLPALDSIATTAESAVPTRCPRHLLGFLSGLEQTLEEGELTVFAPNNTAF